MGQKLLFVKWKAIWSRPGVGTRCKMDYSDKLQLPVTQCAFFQRRLFKVRGLLRQNDEIRTALKMFPTEQGLARAKRRHSKSNFDLYSPPSPPCSLKPLSTREKFSLPLPKLRTSSADKLDLNRPETRSTAKLTPIQPSFSIIYLLNIFQNFTIGSIRYHEPTIISNWSSKNRNNAIEENQKL